MRALAEQQARQPHHWVKDGEEALDYLFCRGAYAGRDPTRPPRLVLLDLKMPRSTASRCCGRSRPTSARRRIPVVVLTSSNEERDIVESYHLGVNSYIVKPVDFASLADVARHAGYYWLAINKVV